jgi:biotin-dependent carboxylase-like uncharacterized protein
MGDFLLVVDPGFFTTVQDGGRFGYQRFGISPSGALDVRSMRIANALVGNDPDAAALEITLSGPTFEVEAELCAFAYYGANAPATVDGRIVVPGTGFYARRGQTVSIGRIENGMRGYLAVSGGVATPVVLGSRSTHTRWKIGGIEGGPLKPQQRLPLLRDRILAHVAGGGDRSTSAGSEIRVVLGPQNEAFTEAAIGALLNTPYRLSSKWDRMACRLEGAVLDHCGDANIISDGIANGSIQVPGNRQPIVLLADRQTTGGYAKIATVIGPDLGKIAQARPGASLTFRSVGAEEAEAIARGEARKFREFVAGLRPIHINRLLT